MPRLMSNMDLSVLLLRQYCKGALTEVLKPPEWKSDLYLFIVVLTLKSPAELNYLPFQSAVHEARFGE